MAQIGLIGAPLPKRRVIATLFDGAILRPRVFGSGNSTVHTFHAGPLGFAIPMAVRSIERDLPVVQSMLEDNQRFYRVLYARASAIAYYVISTFVRCGDLHNRGDEAIAG